MYTVQVKNLVGNISPPRNHATIYKYIPKQLYLTCPNIAENNFYNKLEENWSIHNCDRRYT